MTTDTLAPVVTVRAFNRKLDTQEALFREAQRQRERRLTTLDRSIHKCLVCGARILPTPLMHRPHRCGRRLATMSSPDPHSPDQELSS